MANDRFYLAVVPLVGFFSDWFTDARGRVMADVPFLWVVRDIAMPVLAVEVGFVR